MPERCALCDDTGWVCECCGDKPWRELSVRQDACGDGAADNCPRCNPNGDVERAMTVTCEISGSKTH